MAFPLTPNIGDQHTEADLKYVWTGTSWDLVIESYQKLLDRTVDPTPADTAEQGQIWRNTTTGDAWEYSENLLTGTSEWVRIVSDKSVQLATTQPTTQPDGTSLQAGDVWIDTTLNVNTVYYYNVAGNWVPMTINFDNATAGLTPPPITTQEAIDLLAVRAANLTKGVSFIGTYNASTDFADYTTVSGFVDSALPAPGTANENTYLVIDTAGTPATGSLAGTALEVGDYIVSDGTTWTHIPLGGAANTFTGLTDTPASYTGNAGKVVAVNATETGLEFISAADTHSILASGTTYPGGPTFRDPPTNSQALQVGDRWVDSDTLNTYVYDGANFIQIVPTIVSTTAPATTTEGTLWYNPNVNVLYVRDNVAAAWVGI